MSLISQHRSQMPNKRQSGQFIQPSASQIVQMNKENPESPVKGSDFVAQPKLNRWGTPMFIQPKHSSQVNADKNTSKSSSNSDAASKNGLPNNIKTGAENLSGLNMDDVKVHYNSDKPESIGALAYAQGTDIHLSRGQEKHLPHEAWHVVQQKQGRVKPGKYQAKLGSVNTDSSLETEADLMGAKMISSNNQNDKKNYAQSNSLGGDPVIQRVEVPTNYGKFETTKFDGFEDRGLDMILKFHPDENVVDAKKIALVQSVKLIKESGDPFSLDPNTKSRMVAKGASGGGYGIDRLSDKNNPIYGSDSLAAGKDLKDTAVSKNPAAKVGPTKTYELGHCYKLKPTDAKKDKKSAGLYDQPKSRKKKGMSKLFETTALAVDGVDKDKYYGSVKWGYKIEGTSAAPTLTKIDITEASKGTPTKNFIEPSKLWNKAKTRGTLKVSTSPEATVDLHVVTKGKTTFTSIKLAKDTQLKQLSTISWGTDAAITAEVLTGTSKGKTVDIRNKDVVDMGDGAATKNLPTK